MDVPSTTATMPVQKCACFTCFTHGKNCLAQLHTRLTAPLGPSTRLAHHALYSSEMLQQRLRLWLEEPLIPGMLAALRAFVGSTLESASS